MQMNRRTPSQRLLRNQPPTRPTACKLLAHIMAAAVTGGMLMLLVFGGATITFLYYNNYSPDNLLVLLFGTIIVMAFYRGCLAWQQDLNEYRSRMNEYRNRAPDMRHTCKSKI